MSGYRVCPACGVLVGDVVRHEGWHGALPPGQAARLRFGHPRDWPDQPEAPDVEIPLEPVVRLADMIPDPPPTEPTAPTDPAPTLEEP